MNRLLTLACFIFAVALPFASQAAVLTVDDDGGADYLTIQEAVDAAAWSGDTVLVYPGTYSDWHMHEYYYVPVNVWVEKDLTIISSDGPEVTVIDGGDQVTCCVLAEWDLVLEGFTLTSATGGGGYGYGVAVSIESGAVRGNVITSSDIGVRTSPFWYGRSGGAEGPRETREPGDRAMEVSGNTLEGNTIGVAARYGNVVEGNTITGGGTGVILDCPVGTMLVGNEIAGNGWGVVIVNPTHTGGHAVFSAHLHSNRIVDNTEMNVDIDLWDVDPATCNVTLGGSLEHANDIHGSPISVHAESDNIELNLDATYNYWGSVACSTFVPLMDIDVDLPDSAFVFEPYVDETHTIVYENCEGVAVENGSWGSIKALFREDARAGAR